MTQHFLKIEKVHFDALRSGCKTCEIRFNDRDYQKLDWIVLAEFEPEHSRLTGRRNIFQITHIDNFQQKNNYVVLSLKKFSA